MSAADGDRAFASVMTRPQRFLLRMGIFLALVIAVAVALNEPLTRIFLANPPLNGLIIAVAALGVGYAFRQVWQLRRMIDWIEAFLGLRTGSDVIPPPPMLAPMAMMLRARKERVALNAASMKSILDTVSSRLDESRDITRYLVGLLIFLGLLGTFWGLLSTVAAVVDTIRSLTISEDADVGLMFDTLKSGLEGPLSGMSTAFASSLLGLAGSLVVGFLDLQAAAAQNRFYSELEEWLAGLTRIGGPAGGIGDAEAGIPAYVSALLEQSAESVESLRRTIERAEEGRAGAGAAMAKLVDHLDALQSHIADQQALVTHLAAAQDDMRPVLARIMTVLEDRRSVIDDATRNHIRNLDMCMLRMLEESESGRYQVVSEIRNEIKILTRTLVEIAGRGDQAR